MSKWHSGPPPFPGWWNAHLEAFAPGNLWGWWDGKGWSQFARPTLRARQAAMRARAKGAIYDGDGILWSDYWPENARVPRIDPRMK